MGGSSESSWQSWVPRRRRGRRHRIRTAPIGRATPRRSRASIRPGTPAVVARKTSAMRTAYTAPCASRSKAASLPLSIGRGHAADVAAPARVVNEAHRQRPDVRRGGGRQRRPHARARRRVDEPRARRRRLAQPSREWMSRRRVQRRLARQRHHVAAAQREVAERVVQADAHDAIHGRLRERAQHRRQRERLRIGERAGDAKAVGRLALREQLLASSDASVTRIGRPWCARAAPSGRRARSRLAHRRHAHAPLLERRVHGDRLFHVFGSQLARRRSCASSAARATKSVRERSGVHEERHGEHVIGVGKARLWEREGLQLVPHRAPLPSSSSSEKSVSYRILSSSRHLSYLIASGWFRYVRQLFRKASIRSTRMYLRGTSAQFLDAISVEVVRSKLKSSKSCRPRPCPPSRGDHDAKLAGAVAGRLCCSRARVGFVPVVRRTGRA